MQRSDDSSIYHQLQHEPERVVNLKKLPEWPKGQYHSVQHSESRFHSVHKIFSVQWILSSGIISLKLGNGYTCIFLKNSFLYLFV